MYLLIWWHARNGSWGLGHARQTLYQWATSSGPTLSINSKEQMVQASLMKMYPLDSRPPWNCIQRYDIVTFAKKSLPSFGEATRNNVPLIYGPSVKTKLCLLWKSTNKLQVKEQNMLSKDTLKVVCVMYLCVHVWSYTCMCRWMSTYIHVGTSMFNLCVLPQVLSWGSLIKVGSSKPREPLCPCLMGNWIMPTSTRELNSGLHAYMATTFPNKPSPQPFRSLNSQCLEIDW